MVKFVYLLFLPFFVYYNKNYFSIFTVTFTVLLIVIKYKKCFYIIWFKAMLICYSLYKLAS